MITRDSWQLLVRGLLIAGCAVWSAMAMVGSTAFAEDAGVEQSQFIFTEAPFEGCHASTIVDTPKGIVAAWFAGKEEGDPSVGIWVSRWEAGAWTAPQEVANGITDGTRYPCWNPVLFAKSSDELVLFYKVGPNPREWWGVRKTSSDGGKSWSAETRLPEGILGPVKNKGLRLNDNVYLAGSSTEHDGWRVHMETLHLGDAWKWTKSSPLNDGKEIGAIQPALLRHDENTVQILCRSRQRQIAESWSHDGGKTWSELTLTQMPNNNSGLDAVTLTDGRHLLIYNHTRRGRTPVNLAASEDGKTWQAAAVLETAPGEYSYPAIIQAADGKVHITYTWKRKRIKHVVVDPNALTLRPLQNGNWP